VPRLPDLDTPAHIKQVRIQFATIAVRICSYSTRTNCGGTPCQRANISGDADTATTQVWRRIRCDTLERRVDFLSGLATTCGCVVARHALHRRKNKQMKNGATNPDPLWRRVSKGLTAALMFSVWLVEARGDAISELTAYYNKVDANLARAIERGEIEKARKLLKLRNNVAKELTQKESLASGASNSTPTPALKTPLVESTIIATPNPQVKEKSELERAPRGKHKVWYGRRYRYVDDEEKEESGTRAKVSATPKPTPSATPNGTDTDTSLERWMGPNFNNHR
jgi:hypothetical protein